MSPLSLYVTGAAATKRDNVSSESSPAKRRKILSEKSVNMSYPMPSPPQTKAVYVDESLLPSRQQKQQSDQIHPTTEKPMLAGRLVWPAEQHTPLCRVGSKSGTKEHLSAEAELRDKREDEASEGPEYDTRKLSGSDMYESSTDSDPESSGGVREQISYEDKSLPRSLLDSRTANRARARKEYLHSIQKPEESEQTGVVNASQRSFSSLINYNGAALSFAEPEKSDKEELGLESQVNDASFPANEKLAQDDVSRSERLRLRLNLALFKMQTRQTHTPLSQLEIPRER